MKKPVAVLALTALIVSALCGGALAYEFQGTTVTFVLRDDGKVIGYLANGHAGYAGRGYDIVCAGVSALTQSVLNGLVNVLEAPVDYRIGDASLDVLLTEDADEDQLDQAQLLLLTMYLGLESISDQNPDNLRISYICADDAAR